MRIATWNINSLRLRLPLVKIFVDQYQPDIIAFQETKVDDLNFPLSECFNLGYEHIRFSGERSYNGVAFLSKHPISKYYSLELFNTHKRHIAVEINGIEIHNFYVPAGGDIADIALNSKFAHKLEYLDLMYEWFQKFRSTDQKIILLGDLNVAPFENDVWSSKQLTNVVSHTKIEREKLLRNINDFGWFDIPRLFTPVTHKLYTWWSYRNVDWRASNRGRRLDHIWASKGLKANLYNYHIIISARSYVRPSDHVPVIVDLIT